MDGLLQTIRLPFVVFVALPACFKGEFWGCDLWIEEFLGGWSLIDLINKDAQVGDLVGVWLGL